MDLRFITDDKAAVATICIVVYAILAQIYHRIMWKFRMIRFDKAALNLRYAFNNIGMGVSVNTALAVLLKSVKKKEMQDFKKYYNNLYGRDLEKDFYIELTHSQIDRVKNHYNGKKNNSQICI